MIIPNTNIKLLQCPIEIDNENQLNFANKESQYNYFNSLPKIESDNYSYVRQNSVLYYEGVIDNLINYNYCMYQNESYSDKWFYAFITRMEYENDNTTRIYLDLDVYQTFMFDFQFKASFIEREHVENDSIGLHTYPENVESGEVIINSVYVDPNLNDFLSDTCYVIGTTIVPNASLDNFEYSGGGVYNGLYSGVKYYKFDYLAKDNINNFLKKYAEAGRVDAITGLFIAPQFLCDSESYSPTPIKESNNAVSYNLTFNKNQDIDGYTPKNNKLYCYPFNYCIANNMGGSSNIIRYEDFLTDSCTFRVDGVLCPGCSIRLIPLNYKGININNLEVLTLGKYPICNYSVDMYTNWLTQNSVNIGGQMVSSDELALSQSSTNGLINTLSSLISGDIVGGLQGGLNTSYQIANNMIQQKQHSLIPPSLRGNENAGDVIASTSNLNFKFFHMSIKKEYAQKIDNYFSMYGYLVNDLHIPNLNSRPNWNFIKTIGCNLVGNIPNIYLEELKSIFNNGVTIWHNPSTFLDYSQNNK